MTPETKARVLNVARERSLTESAWIRQLIMKALRESRGSSAPTAEASVQPCDRVVVRGEPRPTTLGKASRLYLRLRSEDQLLLSEPAAVRGMASATYASVLLRSHLRALAPLPKAELAALKHAVGELGAIGRNVNQIARAINQGGRLAGLGRAEFEAILKICEALRDHTKELLKSNSASWASGYAETSL